MKTSAEQWTLEDWNWMAYERQLTVKSMKPNFTEEKNWAHKGANFFAFFFYRNQGSANFVLSFDIHLNVVHVQFFNEKQEMLWYTCIRTFTDWWSYIVCSTLCSDEKVDFIIHSSNKSVPCAPISKVSWMTILIWGHLHVLEGVLLEIGVRFSLKRHLKGST